MIIIDYGQYTFLILLMFLMLLSLHAKILKNIEWNDHIENYQTLPRLSLLIIKSTQNCGILASQIRADKVPYWRYISADNKIGGDYFRHHFTQISANIFGLENFLLNKFRALHALGALNRFTKINAFLFLFWENQRFFLFISRYDDPFVVPYRPKVEWPKCWAAKCLSGPKYDGKAPPPPHPKNMSLLGLFWSFLK